MPDNRLILHRSQLHRILASSFALSSSILSCHATASPVTPRDDSSAALRDSATEYLPYHIGAIAGAYGVSLVLVAIAIFFLSKKRREALTSGANESDFKEAPRPKQQQYEVPRSPRSIPRSPVRNFSYPSPDQAEFPSNSQTPYVNPQHSTSTLQAPGIDFAVDQRVVATDRQMAQAQLEEMYKYVMEQEAAKEQGVVLQGSPVVSVQPRPSTSDQSSSQASKKEKTKPAHLKLTKENNNKEGDEKSHSRTSSILSALRSPKKKNVRGISISSPLMTPNSATFSNRHESQEMNAIPPRQYAPAPPPPVPTDQVPYGTQRQGGAQMTPITPDHPESTMSIDERIGGMGPSHTRNLSGAPNDMYPPTSAASDTSQTPLVGLPSSPRPSVTRFPSGPSLPSSPKPGATFQRSGAPSAVRTGGALPLRAYEPAMTSPTAATQTTKQTTFERMGPLSPMSARTPATGTAVPYSPYQPFTPLVPMTPSLVTRADRKRMKKLEPKTPTMEMVLNEDDTW